MSITVNVHIKWATGGINRYKPYIKNLVNEKLSFLHRHKWSYFTLPGKQVAIDFHQFLKTATVADKKMVDLDIYTIFSEKKKWYTICFPGTENIYHLISDFLGYLPLCTQKPHISHPPTPPGRPHVYSSSVMTCQGQPDDMGGSCSPPSDP